MTKGVIVYSAQCTALLRYISSSRQGLACDTVQHCAVKACRRNTWMVEV